MERTAAEMARAGKTTLSGVVSANSSGDLGESIQKRTGRNSGVVRRIGMNFMRHGYYLEAGAGKGKGGAKGSSWTDATGTRRTTNVNSLNKANTGNRKAKKFIGPTLDKYQVIVADRAAKIAADGTLDLVLGAFETKVR